jgi:hypothetical protein
MKIEPGFRSCARQEARGRTLPLPAFWSRRARIQEIAAKLITERRHEDNGTVIRTGGALKLAEVGMERLSATWHSLAEDRR